MGFVLEYCGFHTPETSIADVLFLEDKLVFTQTKYIRFVRTDWGYPVPECPRTPARGPQAFHHHPRGACRRNFWSGIFDPRDIGATRKQNLLVDHRKVCRKLKTPC